jgi:hypothetical protein
LSCAALPHAAIVTSSAAAAKYFFIINTYKLITERRVQKPHKT